MECTDCKKITRDDFKKEIFVEKKTRYDFVYLMLNILHHITSSGGFYCYCEKKVGKFKICAIPIIFSNFEKDIDRKMFHVNFLSSCYFKLCCELMQWFDEGKSCIDCFLHHKYTFGGRNWNTEQTWGVPLLESIWYSKSIKIAKLKADKLPVPAEFTIDLSVPDIW